MAAGKLISLIKPSLSKRIADFSFLFLCLKIVTSCLYCVLSVLLFGEYVMSLLPMEILNTCNQLAKCANQKEAAQ